MKGKFRKNRKLILFFILIILSLATLLSDISGTIESAPPGKTLLHLSYPFVKLGEIIRKGAQGLGAVFFEAKSLKKENQSLKEQLAQMSLKDALSRSRINALEKSLSFYNFHDPLTQSHYVILPAGIVGRSPNPWSQSLLIDKGTREGVRRQQTVMNESGIVGIVKEAAPDIALVHLVVDQRSAVTVRIQETGEMGVLYGTGERDYFILETEGISRKLRRNDHAITAGTDNSLFPRNIPVGTVDILEQDKYGRTKARVKPFVDFDALEVIFIILGSERLKEKAFEDNF
ncbi:rod shape-determining protein MreC [Candidatus Sumerlaeota bacterium]|nr:rod shape-determining protein MreC [Candidatus Sumerlaeota bacterium]